MLCTSNPRAAPVRYYVLLITQVHISANKLFSFKHVSSIRKVDFRRIRQDLEEKQFQGDD